MKLDLNSAKKIKETLISKNRIVLPPMASATADCDGFVTEKTIEHYKRLSESNAGIMFVEYSNINQIGRSEPNQLSIQSDFHVEGLKKLAKILQSTGAVTGIQITYGGGKSSPKLTGGKMWGPSNVSVPVKGSALEPMHEMNTYQIQSLIDDFTNAAKRAEKAGFDLVELHCAHGYGINQWLSPITNKRFDAFGGSLEKRFELLKRIVTSIKNETTTISIATRIPGQDLLEGGLSIEDMQWITYQLELLGVQLIDVSSGLGGWRRPKTRRGQGYLVGEATEIKKATNVPVIGVGGITEKNYINESLLKSRFDFAAIGRALLASPKDWATNNLNP